MKRLISTGTLIVTLLCFALASCNQATNEAGSFKVRMTDAPGDYAALNLSITSVDVFLENKGWVNLSSQAQNVNVLSLTNGAEIMLANQTNVEAGVYTRLKITFGVQGTIQLNGGGGTANIVWAGNVHEVEIAIHEVVNAETGANVLVDFNVAESVVESGMQYIIEPTVTLVDDVATGIQGEVTGAATAAVILTNGENTFSTYISATGNFIIRGIEPGTYTLSILKPGLQQAHNINNVIITQGQMQQMGQIQL